MKELIFMKLLEKIKYQFKQFQDIPQLKWMDINVL